MSNCLHLEFKKNKAPEDNMEKTVSFDKIQFYTTLHQPQCRTLWRGIKSEVYCEYLQNAFGMYIFCTNSYKSPVIYALIHRTENQLWCKELFPNSRGIWPTETCLVLLKLRGESAPRLAANLQVRLRFLPYFVPPILTRQATSSSAIAYAANEICISGGD